MPEKDDKDRTTHGRIDEPCTNEGGHNIVEADAPECLFGLDRVEFYVDDELKTTDYNEPYSWNWDEQELFLLYTIKVIAYDTAGNSAIDEIGVWKFL